MFSTIDLIDVHVAAFVCIKYRREFTGDILQKNYKETNIIFQMDMALFLSADFHQGNEIFNVHSRGKQYAFMALSALLYTARNIPLSSWSKVTFNNVLIQGDKLYLKALNTGFIVLNQGTDFLSVEHLPKAISVSFLCTNISNDFSYEINCQPMISLPHCSVQENIVRSPNGDLPTV